MARDARGQDTSLEANEVVEVTNPCGAGEFVLACEHASNFIPPDLDNLGLNPDTLGSHIAWDPGALQVARELSAILDAPLVAPLVSRLVYDCNRPLDAPSAIPTISERIEIPGNIGLTRAQRAERMRRVYQPFCEAVSAVIGARKRVGKRPFLITVHSFTPVYFGKNRTTEIGIVHDKDRRIADAMLAAAARLPHRRIERNSPYGPADGVTHSLKVHGRANGLPAVMLEVRNDLVSGTSAQTAMVAELLTLLRPAMAALDLVPQETADA